MFLAYLIPATIGGLMFFSLSQKFDANVLQSLYIAEVNLETTMTEHYTLARAANRQFRTLLQISLAIEARNVETT